MNLNDWSFFFLKNLTYWYFPLCDLNNWCYLFFTLIICLRESLTQDEVTFIGEGLKILTNAQSLQPLRMTHMLQSGAAVWIVDLLCDSCQGFVSRISTSSSSHFIRDSASMRGGRCKSVLYYAILFKWCFAKNNYFFIFLHWNNEPPHNVVYDVKRDVTNVNTVENQSIISFDLYIRYKAMLTFVRNTFCLNRHQIFFRLAMALHRCRQVHHNI